MASSPTGAPALREISPGGDASIITAANLTRESVSTNGATGMTHPAVSRVQRQSTISNVVFRGKEKIEKIGHRRVNLAGVVSYKKTPADQLKRGIQMGLEHFIGQISNKPVRDLLIQDFEVIESVHFPSDGSQMTVAHGSSDFRFECFAPDGFKHFRQGFGIDPSDFLISLCKESLKDLSNPGASGSLFFLTDDDEFIIKTVDHKEAKFLQKLLPGYYMNLIQNPRTLLPKFYGLYCYSSLNKNIRLVIMNNLLPSSVKMHEKYDLKGSTFKRKASKNERDKREPTLKDLDFMELHPKGIILGPVYRKAIMDTIEKDCRVLESFNIMDFSLLLGIHNLDKAAAEEKIQVSLDQSTDKSNHDRQGCSNGRFAESVKIPSCVSTSSDPKSMLVRQPSYHKRLANFPTAFEVIQSTIEADGSGEFTNSDLFTEVDEDIIKFTGGIPARSEKGERLLLFLGVIDILQQYKLKKKVEHAWKSAVHDGNTVSVTRPDFYKQRFLTFISDKIFPKLTAVARPSSSSMPSRPVPTDSAASTAAATSSSVSADVVSPNNISIIVDGNSSSSPNPRVDQATDVEVEVGVDQRPPVTPKDESSSFPFGSPSDSLLTHDQHAGDVASESPSVHPPAFSTPTAPPQQHPQQHPQQQQLNNHHQSQDPKAQSASRSMASEMSDEVFVSDKCASTVTSTTLRVDNHITQDSSSSSLHVGASSDADHNDQSQLSSYFDSSASSDVIRRIRQLEDSSLNSFVGEIPSELKVTSSFLESVVEESSELGQYPQGKLEMRVHQPVIYNMNSSSGVSSVPTSTVKPSDIEIKLKDDETTSISTDPTSSFVTSDKRIITSRTSGLEEDTSGISGISPLEDPSSEPVVAFSGVGDAEELELADSHEWRKLKITFDPPTSSADQDGRGERSLIS